MYAINDSSQIYHLIEAKKNYTLCGFRTAKKDTPWTQHVALHIVDLAPADRELCKQCDKIDKRGKHGSQAVN